MAAGQKTEANTSGLNRFLWVLSMFLLIAALVANQHWSELAWAIRSVAWVAVLLVLAAVLYRTREGKRFAAFLIKVRSELRKVAWPSRQETISSTMVVAVGVVFMSLLLWALDSGLVYLFSLMTGQGSN
jgi:preprotein translocase subunit SecE